MWVGCLARRKSAMKQSPSPPPQTKFGTSKRSDPVYLEGCDDLLLGTVSPGFNYDPKSALGSQVLSKNATSPSYRFGCAAQADCALGLAMDHPPRVVGCLEGLPQRPC